MTLGLLVVASLVAAVSMPAAASATTTAPRIDLKVLLIGTSTTEADYTMWQAALTREGVPYDSIIAAAGHTPITAATLSDTVNGTPEAKYDGVIIASGDLSTCASTCSSGLAQSEWNALEAYEQEFAIRQIDGDVYPGLDTPTVPAQPYGNGLNSPTTSGDLDGVTGTLTTDGQSIFPYLKGSVLFGNYPAVANASTTYGYEATPISTTNFDTLVSGPNGSALVGIYTDPEGVQQMVQTYAQNESLMQAELLQHGALNWLTRGVYFGDQRNYVEMDIDDTFTPDDAWNATTSPGSIDYSDADALRMSPADVTTSTTWEAAHDFRLDQLFNFGSTVAYQADNGGTDPLLAAFQATCSTNCGPGDAGAGKSYANSFGWVSHTYDTPYLDVGCATQNYIEAELNENSNTIHAAPGGTPGTGGLGLTETTDPTVALGAENIHVFVPGNHSGFADLVPGNPATVDPPIIDADLTAQSATGGTLPAGTYEYAVADQFTNSSTAGLSQADITAPIDVAAGTTNDVSISWQAICHASDYVVYRGYTPTLDATTGFTWTQLPAAAGSAYGSVSTPFSATPPDNSSGNPASTTDVTGGGELEQTFTDTGAAGTAVTAPPTAENATELPWEQNPNFIPALEEVGITSVGDDGSKPYPDPATNEFGYGVNYTGAEYPADATFVDGNAQVVPRHPINIYYNASTDYEELNEYQSLYGSGGSTPDTAVCPTGTCTWDNVVDQVVSQMFQYMMGNDPRPSYVHQTNTIGSAPAGSEDPTTGLPPSTYTPQPGGGPDEPAGTGNPTTTGDGTLYQVLDPLIDEYDAYFNTTGTDGAPYEQLTQEAIATLLGEQSNWAASTAVSGYIQGNQVTVTNSSANALETPLTGVPSVGSSYGGSQSGWTSVPSGSSTFTASTTWPAGVTQSQAPQGAWVGTYGTSGYDLAAWDGSQDVSNMPGVTTTLTAGSRTQYAVNTTDARALQAPDGSSVKNAAAYTDPNTVSVTLHFTNAYTGPVSIYALDWNSANLAENVTITGGVNGGTLPVSVPVSGFGSGDWITYPITEAAGATVTITANATVANAGAAISAIMLGGAGAPPVTTGTESPQGNWVGAVGTDGYDLADFTGGNDYASHPGVSLTLVQGSRYAWSGASPTTDVRALQDVTKTYRDAAAYVDPNEVEVQLTFAAAFSGPISVYGLDWDSQGRRELITVNGQTDELNSDFTNGSWVAFPVSVAAGGTVTITADRTAGPNAAISGIFIGGAGTPPAGGPAAAVTTGDASNITSSTATVSGTVNALGNVLSDCHFDYGTTTAYGTQAACASIPAAGGAGTVSASLSGLQPGTTYHFRISATNGGGTTTGTDATFKTAAATVVNPPPPPATAAAVISIGAPVAKCTGTGSTKTCTYTAAPGPFDVHGGTKPKGTVYLVTKAGAPITGAQVKLVIGKKTYTLTTGSKGTASFTLAAGASGKITLSYAGGSTAAAASFTETLKYVAYGTIALKGKRLPKHGSAVFSGKAVGSNGKPAKLAVKVQYLSSHNTWKTVTTVHSSSKGKWTASIKWPRTGHAGKTEVYFRVVVSGTASSQIGARLP